MMLSDREWLRFVTFGIVVGAVMGALYTGALIVRGHPLEWAIVASIIAGTVIAGLVHIVVRKFLDAASEPPADDPEPDATGETA